VIWDWEQEQGKGASNGKKVVIIMEQLVWRREEIKQEKVNIRNLRQFTGSNIKLLF
jgi:hypothetical protein